MVELLERVHVELPIGLDRGTIVEPRGHFGERVFLDPGDHRAGEIAKRLLGWFSVVREVDEDESLPHVAVHAHQAVTALVQIEELFLLLHERQVAVEVVAPGMIYR